jgi:hypothetical protein
MSIPIIFMHFGDSDYLQYSLLQAKKSNKDSDIILIGDESNNKYSFIKHANINDSPSGQAFAKLYQHLSFNSYEYELFCIQRWFILRDFMAKHQISRCYHQDSDVMLYEDISTENVADFDFAFCGGISGGISFINNFEALDDFCNFITAFYTIKPLTEELKNINQMIIKHVPNGGICDMIFIKLYCDSRQDSEKIFDLSIIENNAVFDLNVNLINEYEQWQGRKKIYFTSSGVLCKNLLLNTFIKFKALHFQGEAKEFMKYFVQKTPDECIIPVTFDYSSCQWQEVREIQFN